MGKYDGLICRLENDPVGNIPFHIESPLIKRVCAKRFPLDLAIHHVSLKEGENNDNYCRIHTHNEDEINIIIASDNFLEYKIQLGDEIYIVESPSAVFIPKNLSYSANFLAGDGYFVCLKFPGQTT